MTNSQMNTTALTPTAVSLYRPGNGTINIANPRSNSLISMAAVAPDLAKTIIESRPVKQVTPIPGANPAKIRPAIAGIDVSVPEGAASIVELARALQGTQVLPFSPQTFFEFVYNNIDYIPGYGLAKGSLGTLLDGCGNPFDQCALLAALLRQVGFVVNYEVGTIQLTAAQITAWLGVTDGTIATAANVLAQAGVPVATAGANIQLGHCWLKVNIGTSGSPDWVMMDPSFKTYTTTAGINLASAMNYTQSTFLSQARAGYTIDAAGEWVQNLNRANIRGDLTAYAESLIAYIRANNPTATMDQIIGGRQIVPAALPVTFPTTLPYYLTGSTVTEFTGDFSTSYKVTLNIDPAGMNVLVTSDQIYGRRLTWFYSASGSSYVPTLALDGVTLAVGAPVASGSSYNVVFVVDHNAYPTTGSNQTFQFTVYAPGEDGLTGQTAYLFGNYFGPMGKGFLDYHQALGLINQFGASEFNEPALGEQLSVQWATYGTQLSRLTDILNRMTNTILFNHHTIGAVSLQDYGTAFCGFDIQGVSNGGAVLDSSVTNLPAVGIVTGMHGFALETLAIQQVTGLADAISTTRVFDVANSAGTKMYKATAANWTGGSEPVEPLLSGYSMSDLTYVGNVVASGDDVWIPQTTGQTFNGWTFYGYSTVNPAGGAGGITYGNYGGAGRGRIICMPPDKDDDCEDADPVDIRTGNFRYRHTDLVVGSGDEPYSLSMVSSYDSLRRGTTGPLGYGWTHNWATSVTVQSDGLRGLGRVSAISGAASLSELFVTIDLLSDTTLPVDKYVMALLGQQWWVDQQTNNVVTLKLPDDRDYTFTLLPDGTYQPTLRDASVLTLTGGIYTHTTPQQVVSTFNAAGQLASVSYPTGMVVTLSYSGANLYTVSNNRGRTLTFGYTSGFISSVTDGARTIRYSVDGVNLTNFIDALNQNYFFSYVSFGLMLSYFKPQNPSNACVVNTYDTLGRVQSQVDILGHPHTFYLAGSRSEVIDPAGNSEVTYYDTNDNPLKWIDALGRVTTVVYDNLGRTVSVTNPELDLISFTYDGQNNILTKTRTAKPGSGLSALAEFVNENWAFF